MTKNNEARVVFKQFVLKHGYATDGNKNVFFKDGKRWLFVSDTSKTSIRQFYENCDGAYVSGSYIPKSKFKLLSVTRIDPTGVKAYQAVLA